MSMFGPERVPERGMRSPYAWVEWYPEDGGHGHLFPLGDGRANLLDLGMSIEDVAFDLAEAVSACNESRHNGHGKTHSKEEIEESFRGAVSQLLVNEFDNDWARAKWLQMAYKKWGGHAPAMVIVPKEENPHEVELMVTDRQANPVFYEIDQRDFEDVFTPPTEVEGAQKLEYGWRLPRRWSARRRLDHMRKKGL